MTWLVVSGQLLRLAPPRVLPLFLQGPIIPLDPSLPGATYQALFLFLQDTPPSPDRPWYPEGNHYIRVATPFLLEDPMHLNGHWPLWNLSSYVISVLCPLQNPRGDPSEASASHNPAEIFELSCQLGQAVHLIPELLQVALDQLVIITEANNYSFLWQAFLKLLLYSRC